MVPIGLSKISNFAFSGSTGRALLFSQSQSQKTSEKWQLQIFVLLLKSFQNKTSLLSALLSNFYDPKNTVSWNMLQCEIPLPPAPPSSIKKALKDSLYNSQSRSKSKADFYVLSDSLIQIFLAVSICKYYEIHESMFMF